jgi:uncharacterized Zn finger protein
LKSELPVFYLLLDTRRPAAELMAECPSCGAITTGTVEETFRAGSIHCNECGSDMDVTSESLHGLRIQAIRVKESLDQLLQMN